VFSSTAEATVCTVTLEKTSAGLGFSLEGGKGSLHGDKPLTINRIFKGGVSFCFELQACGQAPQKTLEHFRTTLVSHNPRFS
jgi:hypothetical protein